MTDNDKINIGDRVFVDMAPDQSFGVRGKVLYVPQATGDCWHIKTETGLVYVQNFSAMWKIEEGKP